ncbi:zinc ABC transporter permease [Opitutaceae bacterium TAV5]|nr:zinc ABC transporter permease [Opitutaceae bacterium TAV5]
MTAPWASLREMVREAAGANGWLPDSLGYAFVINALACALLIGPLLGGLGALVVTKRLAFFSQAIGQAALTGVAIGILVGEAPDAAYASLFAFCGLFALTLNYVRQRSRLPSDTVIAVFLSVALAAGSCLLVFLAGKADIHLLDAVLFGSILTVNDGDIAVLLATGAVALAVTWRWGNGFVLASFQPGLARVRGVRVVWLEYVFILLVTLVTVASVKIIGAILVEALLVIPASAGRLLGRSLRSFFLWSIGLCTASCVLGVLVPVELDIPVPSGGAIILVAATIFTGALLFSKVRL